MLETERGPLPMPQLLKLAQVSRALIERMLRDGLLEGWEEPIDPVEDPFDTGYTPPAHTLNETQESAFTAIRARFELGEFGVQLLHGVTGSGKTEVYLRSVQDTLARGQNRDHSGAGNCVDAVDRAAMPGVVWRAIRRRGGAAFGAERCGTRAGMVARAQWRGPRGGGDALGDFCAAGESRASSSSMRSRRTATSRKRRRGITGATWPSCARNWKMRWRCWDRPRLRWRPITTR